MRVVFQQSYPLLVICADFVPYSYLSSFASPTSVCLPPLLDQRFQAEMDSSHTALHLTSQDSSVGQTECFDNDRFTNAGLKFEQGHMATAGPFRGKDMDLLFSGDRLQQGTPAANLSPSNSPEVERAPAKSCKGKLRSMAQLTC